MSTTTQSVVVPVEPTFTPIDYLRLIAEGYEVIEATGSQMTIQSPDDEGPQELVIDVDALAAAPAPSSLAGGEVTALRAAYDRWVHEDAEAVEVIERVGVFLAALSPEAPAREGESKGVNIGLAIAAGIAVASGAEGAAREILGAAGLTTEAAMRDAGVDTYDINLLAGIIKEMAEKVNG